MNAKISKHITRVGGHARLTIILGENEAKAHFNLAEFRGFEMFLKGRKAEEAQWISSRICGICHMAHVLASVKAVEDIDEFYVQPLLENVDLGEVAVVVTADHATPYTVKSHTDDPVPLVVAARWVKPDGIDRFTERECAKGTLGVIPHGWLILPRALSVLREASKTYTSRADASKP